MVTIARLEVVPLAIRYKRPTAGGKGGVPILFDQVNPVLVRLWSSEGHHAFGYAKTFTNEFVRPLAELIAELGALVIGRDAMAVTAVADELRLKLSHAGTRGLAQYALAAIETALWDMKARILGLPLFRLLGGEKRELDVYANHLLWRNWTKDELAADSAALVAAGFRAVKMNAGRIAIAEDIGRIAVVRETVGPDIGIHVDSNWSWEYAEAVRFVRDAEALGIAWIEDPLRSNDARELGRLNAISPVPVAAGELLNEPSEVREFLAHGATRHLQLDLQYMGGIGSWMRGAAIADSHGIRVSSHLFHDVSAHLVSACRNAAFVEYMEWWDVLYEEPLPIRDGKIVLHDASGLGLTLSDSALAAHAYRG